ncbi:lectin-domain protein, putative [Perkinsus marinus ATCC 50983]|uniref:Lectin-domain protein, putative n=1 Tax=Perkinsus marinus (strain ATCC 50983 / TXsc) TaxID=423536 RepID=C5L326_PERM5|nr:lectin-domain protein, putative [Perkinsus marinus ATCC 50983]EER08913.1 lectin-domain protein, putative [Perkinsus marinus ATCC 50983]|eukprot:XP_002777097.1 lectin-domain protein, putative [Perkinsus marinus ATCC 50983]
MISLQQLSAAPLLLLLLLVEVVSGQVQLESHSFTQALDRRVFNKRWNAMGTCVLENDHILLTPRTADRFAALWHKSPLRTDNFEATFTLDLKNPPDGTDPKHEQGFAFWYVYDDPTTQYPSDVRHCSDRCTALLENAGLGLMGYKSNFNGMAIFFPNNRFVDGRMDLQPSASLAMNDGSLIFNRQVDLPTGYGSFWDYRNRRLTVQVRVQPESVVVQGRFSDTDPWTLLINYQVSDPNFRIRPNGYIGITSLVAPVGGQIINLVDYVALNSLNVVNYDPGQKGEDAEIVTESYDDLSHPDPVRDKALASSPEALVASLVDLKLAAYKIITELEPMRWRTEQGMKELQASQG